MPASKAQRAATAERRAQAIALRLEGATYDKIADQLGYSGRGEAWTDLDRAFKQRAAELAEQVDTMRHIEAARYDLLQQSLWPAAMAGDVKAVEAVLRVSDRRMRLWGFDAPTRAEVSVAVPATEEERREQLADLARLAQYAVTGDAEAILAAADEGPEE